MNNITCLIDLETRTLHLPPCDHLPCDHPTREVTAYDLIRVRTRAISIIKNDPLFSKDDPRHCEHCITTQLI